MKTLLFTSLVLFSSFAKGQELPDSISSQKQIAREAFANYHIGDTVVFAYKNGFVSEAQGIKYTSGACKARGIVKEKDETTLLIKVRLIEGCDKQGIIAYDNKNLYLRNRRTGEIEKPGGLAVYMKPRKELWFRYSDWERLN